MAILTKNTKGPSQQGQGPQQNNQAVSFVGGGPPPTLPSCAQNPSSWYCAPITHGYIPGYNPSIGDTPHYADDLGTGFHTDLTTLYGGTVKVADYAVWNGQPGGGEVFIAPDAGGPEFYMYHLDLIDSNITPGAHVYAGQHLGLSGGQNSGGYHPVSSMWSSGPHTHVGFFTNYINTPIGGRPFGPDVTPTLQAAQAGNVVGQPGGPGGFPWPFPSIDFCTIPPISWFCPGSTINWQDLIIRFILVVAGLIILFIGFSKLFDMGISFPAPSQGQPPEEPGGKEGQPKEAGASEEEEIAAGA